MIRRWLCRIGRHRMIEELGLGALSIWSCERRGCDFHHVVSNWGQNANRITRVYGTRPRLSTRRGWAIPPVSEGWTVKPIPDIQLKQTRHGLIPTDEEWPPPVKPEPRPNVSHVFRPYRHR